MSESTNNHTPKAVDGIFAEAEDINRPLRQLDFAIGKHNLTAVTDPTTADNATQGYTTGKSLWFNRANGAWWLCTDAAQGIWQQISLGGAVAGHSHSAADIISGLLSLLVGGTGANLSASGPGVVVQDGAGAALSSRALQPADLPAASTTSQGAVELATNTEAIGGQDATRAITPASLAATLAQALSDIALESSFITQSSGGSSAGKKIKLNGYGKIDISMLSGSDILSFIALLLQSQGDLLVRNNTGALSRLPIGGQGQILSVDLTNPTGFRYTSPVTSGSGIPIGTINAKGDLLVGTADDTVVRLPIGTIGHALTVDPSAPEGVSWQNKSVDQPIRIYPDYTSLPINFTDDLSGYGIYKLVGMGRLEGSGTVDLMLRLNGATTGYTWHSIVNNGSTLTPSQAVDNGTYIPVALQVAQSTIPLSTNAPLLTFELIIQRSFIWEHVNAITVRGQVEEKSSSFKSRQITAQFPYASQQLFQISLVSSGTSAFVGSVTLYGVKLY